MKVKITGFRVLLLVVLLVAVGTSALFLYRLIVPANKIRHIVLISIDTCRADHLSCYGYPHKITPNIDAVAAESIQFNHAVTSVPLTLPAHSSMLTGTTPLYHKVRDNSNYRLGDSNITLAEILRDKGFATSAVVGAFVIDSQFGLDQGFDTYNDDLKKDEDKPLFSFNERDAEDVTRCANTWLQENKDNDFFLFLHYFDPHIPYKMHMNMGFPFTSQSNRLELTDRYDSEIAYTDYWIGRVVKKLKELELYDSTLLIITADHGESLGDHSEGSHGFFIYYSTLHVPLIIRPPKGIEHREINDVAGLIDIVPTVCGLLGIDAPQCVQGRDFSGYFGGNSVDDRPRSIYCETFIPTKFSLGPLFGIVNNDWHYIHTAKPELYNLTEDHREINNLLSDQPRQADIMENELVSTLENSSSNKMVDNKLTPDEATRARLQSLGYISNRTVNENIELEQNNLDPKDFVEMYNFNNEFMQLASDKEYEQAKKLVNDILSVNPEMKQAHYFLGLLASYQEDTQGMLTHFTRYIELVESSSATSAINVKYDFDISSSHIQLANIFRKKEEFDLTIEHYKKAIVYNPYSEIANFRLGAIYAKLGNRDLALKHALRACELTDYKDASMLDSLSVAYAISDRFPEAIETARKALELAKSMERPLLAEEIKAHLELYKNRQHNGFTQ